MVSGYALLHNCWEAAYKDDIRPDVGNAVKLYGLREVARTGALELTVDGRAYTAGSEDPGPLGVNQIPSVRGLLAGTSQAIGAYNSQLVVYLDRIFASFALSRRNPRYSWAPLSAVAPNLVATRGSGQRDVEAEEPGGMEDAPTGGLFRIEVPSSVLEMLRELPRSEATAQRLIAAVQSGMVYRTSDVYPLPIQDEADGADESKAYVQLAKGAIDAAAEMCLNVGRLGEQLRGVFGLHAANDPQSPNAVPGQADNGCAFVPLIAATGDYYARRAPDCDPSGPCDSRCGMGCFHAELEHLVLKNPGFFWTMGKFRWLEVLLLAALGVIVRRLLDFSLVFVRLQRRSYQGSRSPPVFWNPRESVRTLIYLGFTPFLALAVVWVFTATDLLAEDAVKLGEPVSHGIIVLAFLLGLFPNVAYDVLNRVVHAVFGGAGDGEADRRIGDVGAARLGGPGRGGGPATGPTPGADDDDVRGPPSFERLRIRVRELLTGPLR